MAIINLKKNYSFKQRQIIIHSKNYSFKNI